MTDIVERLRDGIISRGVQVEAAYEIVRLRAALREIGELPGELNPSNYTHDDVCILNDAHIEAWAIARAALGGNK